MGLTPGILNAMQKTGALHIWHTCGDCQFGIPKYPGRYPASCPHCGCDITCQDGYPGAEVAEALSVQESIAFHTTMRWIAEKTGAIFLGEDGKKGVFVFKTGVREEPVSRLECELRSASVPVLERAILSRRAEIVERNPKLTAETEEDMVVDPRFKKPIPDAPRPEGVKLLLDDEPDTSEGDPDEWMDAIGMTGLIGESLQDDLSAALKALRSDKSWWYAHFLPGAAAEVRNIDGRVTLVTGDVGDGEFRTLVSALVSRVPGSAATPPRRTGMSIRTTFSKSSMDEAAETKFQSAIAMVVKDRLKSSQILIGRSTSKDKREGLWCFPAGKIDDGEDPEDAAVRETWEETGVTAKKTGVLIRHPEYPKLAFVVLDFVEGRLSPNNEFSELKWLPVKDAWDHADLFDNVESLIQRMSGELDVVEHIRTRNAGSRPGSRRLGEASGAPPKPTSAMGSKPVSAGQGAPKPDPETAGSSFKQADAAEKPEPDEPEEPDEREAKKLDLPEPVVDEEGEDGDPMGGEDGADGEGGEEAGAPQVEPAAGPKRIDLRFPDAEQAQKAGQWLRSMGVEVDQGDGFTVPALAKDMTDMEIITRTAEAYGLKLAGAK